MANKHVFEIRTINNDTWHIHYHRLDRVEVKVTCELMRPNRKFWQSKVLWSDSLICGVKDANILDKYVEAIINTYYKHKPGVDKFDEFFNSFVDN